MDTPARRDGTPDRNRNRHGRAERAADRGGYSRGDRSDRGGYSPDRGTGRGGYSQDRGAGRGGYSQDRGSGRGGYSDDRGTDRGGYSRDRGSGRGGYSDDRGAGRGGYSDDRGTGRGGYSQNRGAGRGGYSSDRGAGRGGYSAERSGRGGYAQDRGSRGDYSQDRGRGGYSQDRGSGRGGYSDERGTGRGYAPDRGGRGGNSQDRGSGRGGYGSGRGSASERTGGGNSQDRGRAGSAQGRPAAGRGPTPNRKPKPTPQRKQPTVLSFAKPARHQHVEGEEEQQGPKRLPWGEGERLQKVLAKAGVASRRVAEELIEQGRIEVDGVVVREQGLRIDPDTAVVRVDGVRIVVRDEQVYLALNKPKGFQSTMSDEFNRPCVGDIVAERVMAGQRLFHVGRLDADTEGLLLLTNDGDLAHRLMHPSFQVSKTYLATVDGEVQREVGKRLRKGVELDDGPATVDDFQVLEVGEGRSLVKVVLHEGRKHIVRRLLAAVGHPVTALVRTRIGPVALGDQRPGTLRVLGRDEIGKLYEAVDL